ncbi:hypothetical protein JCM14469_09440 [Desulfatiferula olefinivorans]
MITRKRIISRTTPFLCLALVLVAHVIQAQDIPTLRSELDRAIDAEISAQKKADSWSMEKQQLIGEIRQLNTRIEWLSYQNTKYDAYIKTEQQTLAALERRDEDMQTLRRDLEPYLDDTLSRLSAFIDEDLSFLPEERRRRLVFLKDSVNDYHLSLSEKLNRVLEALNVEAEYGRSIEAETRTLAVDGRTVEADVLRLGRLALFYRALNGREVGRLNPETGTFERLDDRFSRAIRDTLDMARQQKSVELVDLPIGGVTP